MTAKLEQTDLYRLLRERCAGKRLGTIDGDQLLSRVKEAAAPMATLLDRTSAAFPDYTLHDEDHAVRVAMLMHRLLPLSELNALTAIDIAVLILAAYAHDTGMAAGRTRRREIEATEEYQDFLLRNEDQWQESEQAAQAGEAARAEFLRSQLFQNYLRSVHHAESARLCRIEFKPLLSIQGNDLSEAVALLSQSHGEPVSFVASLDYRHPFATDFLIDLPFLACLLRLADYLDMDPARAPESLMRLIGPDGSNEIAVREWRKHQAANYAVRHDLIRFRADCHDFFQHKALQDTLHGIDAERRGCMEFLSSDQYRGDRSLQLNAAVEQDIQAHDYVFEEFKFQLHYREIMSLLMGARLYSDERVFIRELLQNAIDACRHAEATALAAGQGARPSRIIVRHRVIAPENLPDAVARRVLKHDEQHEVVEIEDNGTGMTNLVIRDYFMQVGRSFYQSYMFRRQKLAFEPISQFGIGVLSCFMQSDYIEVETRPDPLVHPLRVGESPGLKLEIRGTQQYFVVRKLRTGPPGTLIRVYLKRPLAESAAAVAARYVKRAPATVEIEAPDTAPTRLPQTSFDLTGPGFLSFADIPDAFGYSSADLRFDGRFGYELHGIMRFFLLQKDNRRFLNLRNAGNYSAVGFSPAGETLVNVARLTPDVVKRLTQHLSTIQSYEDRFPRMISEDIQNIVRQMQRVADELLHQHASNEVEKRWSSLQAQINALRGASAYRTSTAMTVVSKSLAAATAELESFVTGSLTLASPHGVATQDGIDITSILRLPLLLKLAIGCQYNLDLCGKHRVSLSVSRDEIVSDLGLRNFVTYMHEQIGAFLGAWFNEQELPADQIANYLQRTPQTLRRAVERGLGQGRAAPAIQPER